MLAILAAALLAAAPQNDTVYTADGGRLVGTVVEESPQGVTVQLPDGTTRKLGRSQVTRIEYSDGSVSTPSRPAPPPPSYRAPPAPPPYAPPPAYGPPPGYRPPAPPPPAYPAAPPPSLAPPRPPPPAPFYAAFGLGGMFLSGEAEAGVSMDRLYGSQLGIWLEGGMRLTPHLGLGLYLDLGVGDPSSDVRTAYCEPYSCSATTGRFGVLLRHAFTPSAPSTPWIAVGTGWEFGSVSFDDAYGGSSEIFRYDGWEMLRLMVGVDLRPNPVFGVGLYAGVSFGTYTSYEGPDTYPFTVSLDERTHTTVEAGLRFTLFP